MKFGENLKLNLTHEWRQQYIDYEKLKGTFKYTRYFTRRRLRERILILKRSVDDETMVQRSLNGMTVLLKLETLQDRLPLKVEFQPWAMDHLR